MADTVRIEPAAHAALAELAHAKHVTLTEALSRAVEALRREEFFNALNAGYAELRAATKVWAKEEAERALWEGTVADGLDADPYPDHGVDYPAAPRKRALRKRSK